MVEEVCESLSLCLYVCSPLKHCFSDSGFDGFDRKEEEGRVELMKFSPHSPELLYQSAHRSQDRYLPT